MIAVAGRSLARRPLRAAAVTAAVRCKSAASPSASASENIKTFKIYRWDPDVEVWFDTSSASP